MADVRTTVTLTNAVDDGLARRGHLPADRDRSVVVDAVADPDATRSVLPQTIVDQLGLRTARRDVTQSPGGDRGPADVTGAIRFACQGRTTIDEAIVGGAAVIICYTVVAELDLVPDPAAGRLGPHPARPDHPVSMVR